MQSMGSLCVTWEQRIRGGSELHPHPSFLVHPLTPCIPEYVSCICRKRRRRGSRDEEKTCISPYKRKKHLEPLSGSSVERIVPVMAGDAGPSLHPRQRKSVTVSRTRRGEDGELMERLRYDEETAVTGNAGQETRLWNRLSIRMPAGLTLWSTAFHSLSPHAVHVSTCE